MRWVVHYIHIMNFINMEIKHKKLHGDHQLEGILMIGGL